MMQEKMGFEKERLAITVNQSFYTSEKHLPQKPDKQALSV
jgi:sulfur carrier protein ThiS